MAHDEHPNDAAAARRPPGIRRVVTERSVWLFDETRRCFLRIPRGETPYHPWTAYTGRWEPYLEVVKENSWYGGLALHVVQPTRTTVTYVPPELEPQCEL